MANQRPAILEYQPNSFFLDLIATVNPPNLENSQRTLKNEQLHPYPGLGDYICLG